MIDNKKDDIREDHLTFIADYALLASVLSIKWENAHKDSLEHNGLSPLRFGDMEIEQAYQRNDTHNLILLGNANPSLADASELLKSKIAMPPPDGSLLPDPYEFELPLTEKRHGSQISLSPS